MAKRIKAGTVMINDVILDAQPTKQFVTVEQKQPITARLSGKPRPVTIADAILKSQQYVGDRCVVPQIGGLHARISRDNDLIDNVA